MTWLIGWSYRKSVTISRSVGAVSNYQMKTNIGQSSGSPNADVHCHGNVKSDFSDLRFTNSDGQTLLDYWIEEIVGTSPNQTATVWIECDYIGTSATTFYLYYGNLAASAYSNGENTFIAFDDFEDDTVGQIPSGWSEDENPAYGTFLTISNGHSGKGAQGSCTAIVYSARGPTISPGTQSCIEARVRFPGNGEFRLQNYRGGFRREDIATTFKYLTNNPPYWIDSGIPEDANWHKLKMMIYDTNKIDYYFDNYSFLDKDIFGSSQSWGFYGVRFQQTGTVEVDTIFVRNFRKIEPNWGTWGSQENAPMPINVIWI